MNNFIKIKDLKQKRSNLPLLDFDIFDFNFEEKTHVNLIVMYIDVFLLTPKGSLFFNRDFGTTIYEYLYEQLDEQTLTEIKTSFTEELLISLPMLDLINVTIYPSENNLKTIIVNIEFSFDKQTYAVTRSITTPIHKVF